MSFTPVRSIVTAVLGMSLLSGCASMIAGVTSGLAEDLAATILNSEDVETVREGVPAYLLMIDSFLRSSPEDPALLLAASNLNGAFSIFTSEDRSRLLTTKSLDYALTAACLEDKRLCELRSQPFVEFQQAIDGSGKKLVPVMYAVGVAWAGWIQSHSDDFNAIAQLGRVKHLMARVVSLDEGFDNGGPQLYMGGLETVLPDSMGGNLEKGRRHFERAIELSGGKYLMTKVIFAEQYGRLAFDKALHDQLLNEVLAADATWPGMTLTNTVAKRRAAALLEESDEYF